jgi:hypothetical protein
MKTLIAILVLCSITVAGEVSITMDAADRDRNGVLFDGFQAVRWQVGNASPDTALGNTQSVDCWDITPRLIDIPQTWEEYVASDYYTYNDILGGGAFIYGDARFSVDYTSGSGVSPIYFAWSNPDNPWYGAGGTDSIIRDGVEYIIAGINYQTLSNPRPIITIRYEPGIEGTIHEIMLIGIIPPDMTWDVCYGLEDATFFHSPAQGTAEYDGTLVTFSDDNRYPQTVPEPATLAFMALGGLYLARRKQQND